MKPISLLAPLCALSAGASAQTATPLYPALSRTIDSLAVVDQWPMQRMANQLPDSAGRKLADVERGNFARHQPMLERIIRRYGYPGFREVGEKSAGNFWLLVQHADANPDFQRRVLKLMLPQVKTKNANPINYAYLTDRVAQGAGQLQEYGTQVTYKGPGIGKAEPTSLRDPENVNKRRAAIGMNTLEDYLQMMNNMHEQMNGSQPIAP